MSQPTSTKNNDQKIVKGINKISVSGYKSIYENCVIEVCPLTIFAGANSSGKSSIMQPLMMLKQTLEATYDPGALLLNGPNVKFTSATQLFSQVSGQKVNDSFTISLQIENVQSITNTFIKHSNEAIDIAYMKYKKGENEEEILFSPDTLQKDIIKVIPEQLRAIYTKMIRADAKITEDNIENMFKLVINRSRCFFEIVLSLSQTNQMFLGLTPVESLKKYIRQIIHVPGLRGNPERTYKTTAISTEFPGTFENYVASVINQWQKIEDKRLEILGNALEKLGLTCKIEAKQVDDTQVELRVGRLPKHSDDKNDMVSIADVGFGVSQTLPVLVALLVAEPGQLVYIEQPEIHLHPRAQVALAEILSDAANRGVKVVIETHSDKLLLAIQSLVAECKLSPDLVKLHWFTRQENGVTKVSSADLDKIGAFGDWPEDFGDVSLNLENRYLTAAEAGLFNEGCI